MILATSPRRQGEPPWPGSETPATATATRTWLAAIIASTRRRRLDRNHRRESVHDGLAQLAAQDLAQEILRKLADDLNLSRPLVLPEVLAAVVLQRRQVERRAVHRHHQRLDQLA